MIDCFNRIPALLHCRLGSKSEMNSGTLHPPSRKYVYITMDGGASIGAAKLSKHCPVARLFQSEGQKKGDFAQTATGEVIYNEGKSRVEGFVDGHTVTLGFVNMDVSIPVASVRQFISTGHDVNFVRGGCCVQHRESGSKIRVMELDGVFFMKMLMKHVGPHSEDENKPKAGFARPVPRVMPILSFVL